MLCVWGGYPQIRNGSSRVPSDEQRIVPGGERMETVVALVGIPAVAAFLLGLAVAGVTVIASRD